MLSIGTPDLSEVRTYKGVHALCTVKANGDLKATHFASLLIGGSRPTWGIWNANGKFLRYSGSKQQIADSYPKLVWRRVMATWGCIDPQHKTVATRRIELIGLYGGTLPNGHDKG